MRWSVLACVLSCVLRTRAYNFDYWVEEDATTDALRENETAKSDFTHDDGTTKSDLGHENGTVKSDLRLDNEAAKPDLRYENGTAKSGLRNNHANCVNCEKRHIVSVDEDFTKLKTDQELKKHVSAILDRLKTFRIPVHPRIRIFYELLKVGMSDYALHTADSLYIPNKYNVFDESSNKKS